MTLTIETTSRGRRCFSVLTDYIFNKALQTILESLFGTLAMYRHVNVSLRV